jgi:hypothetical protein
MVLGITTSQSVFSAPALKSSDPGRRRMILRNKKEEAREYLLLPKF